MGATRPRAPQKSFAALAFHANTGQPDPEKYVAAKTKTPINGSKPAKEVSVMAWIEDHFGNVLLLKQAGGKKLWTLPGGKVRPRESLLGAMRRELQEETGLRVLSAILIQMFERPEKGNLTFLFHVRIRGSDIIYPREGEIETARFSASLPKSATPSLAFFWKLMHKHNGSISFLR